MDFITVRDLRVNTSLVWDKLKTESEIVITSNGRPLAVMTGVTGKTLEDILSSIREARAKLALSKIRKEAQAKGLDKLSMNDIDDEIKKARQQRKKSLS